MFLRKNYRRKLREVINFGIKTMRRRLEKDRVDVEMELMNKVWKRLGLKWDDDSKQLEYTKQQGDEE